MPTFMVPAIVFVYTYIMVLVVMLTIWTLAWKAYALWIAVERKDKRWFIALLILNTAGILEIIYVFKIAKKTKADIREALRKTI